MFLFDSAWATFVLSFCEDWDIVQFKMADGDGSGRNLPVPIPGPIGTLRMSTIIPAIEQARRQRPPIIPSIGLPQATRTPQELMVERVMENCAFKSALAGVAGR